MKTWRIACLISVVIAAAAVLPAADSRTFDAPIETVWDEAVKATRDADLVLTDSDRDEHTFTMQTPKKTLARTVDFEVTLSQTGEMTQVRVRAIAEEGSNKSTKVIAKFFAALDRRLN